MSDPGYYLDPSHWDLNELFANSPMSQNVEDRRGEPLVPSIDKLLEDIKNNNFISRWMRGGQYSGPGYEYVQQQPIDYNNPMTIALGAHHIPVTSYGTTHPLKRYNPAFNSDTTPRNR